MGTDTYLHIVFPGMSDWRVEEVRNPDGGLAGYQVARTQVAAMTLPGEGEAHRLDEVRNRMEARAKELNRLADPLVLGSAQ